MYSLRTHAWISGGLFAAIILMAIVGNVLVSTGLVRNPEAFHLPARIIFLSLFVAFGFSMIPLMVKLVLASHVRAGNTDVGLVRLALDHETGIIWTLWSFIALGLAIALPFAIQDNFLGGTSTPDTSAAEAIAKIPTQGTVVAAPGMTLDDVVRGSTFKVRVPRNVAVGTPVEGAGIFDFGVAGTGIVFPRCRYYFITFSTHNPRHIEGINVGTSPGKMTKAALDAANAELRSRLKADGWLTGHEVYKTEEDQQLHGGEKRGEEGWLWQKGDTLLHVEMRRLDDPVAGENTATSGDWIQYIDLRQHDDYPWIDRYEFAPAQN